VPIAGDLGWNLDELIERMWEYLDLIRVYTKPKGKDPDYDTPVIIQRCKSTIEDFCLKIHRNMIKDFRYAMVWGTSVKFNPQKVGKEHQLYDEDVVQIIKKI
jgi:ribosome-interacting GTPase 1